MKKASPARWCIECRWCGMRIDLDSGSHYVCVKKGDRLEADILHRPACESFEPPPAVAHWGP